jgi:2-polyprenyl-6-hydroxyphenyl methylase/3-demethylubiquinone-9 3-methyltransferase
MGQAAGQAGGREPDTAASVDAAEIAKFAAMAEAWWDPHGKFRPLHRFNPVRLTFIRDRLCAHFGRDPLQDRPLAGLKLLDVGCGGGLLCEPLARLGAEVTGLDAAEKNIRVAALHAEESGLRIDYRYGSVEALAESSARFDAVLNMEVVEHVADVGSFLAASAALVRPGGLMILATLNRTPKAFLLAIVGAEYLLRWLPRGTHDWRRFVRPSELARALRQAGMDIAEMTGVAYNPLTDAWRLAPRDLDVNYMLLAVKDPERAEDPATS